MMGRGIRFTFSMDLSDEEYQSYYRGVARDIIVMTHQGVRVQFPASSVLSFVERDGVHGDFVITMDDNNKLVSLEKISN